MNTQELSLFHAVQLVERGRETDVIKAYELVSEAVWEGMKAADIADECQIHKSTAGYYMLGAYAWERCEKVDDFAANLRSAIITSAKNNGMKTTRAIVEGEWSTLSELIAKLEWVEPKAEVTEETQEEEATEEEEAGEEESNDKTPLVDVVLAALPHLNTEDLARVWDALAELASVKALELV